MAGFILLLIIAFYVGTVLSKVFLHVIYNKNFAPEILFVPFSTLGKASMYQIKQKTLFVAEVSSAAFAFLFTLGVYTFINEYGVFSTTELLVFISFNLFIFISLLYLSVYDIAKLAIPERFLKILVFVTVIVNLAFGVYKFIMYRSSGEMVFSNLQLGDFGNILTAAVLAGIILLINKLTKNKGIGEGDIYIMLVIGLVFGYPLGFASFFLTSIVGSVIAILYSVAIQKFKGVMVPFIPLVVLGYVLTLIYGVGIMRILFFSF